jgi:hypothetical protein
MLGRLGDGEVVPTGGSLMTGRGGRRWHGTMGSRGGAWGEQSRRWLHVVARR